MRKFTKYPSNYVKASFGSNSDRFEFVVYDPYMYDDIMDAIDNVCESTMGSLFSEKFYIEGPYSERFDVVDILNDFGVDWEEV